MENKEQPKKSRIAITNVRIFNGETVTPVTTVIIEGSTIVAGEDTEGAQIVDGKGHVLLPGLIDCHVHVRGEQDLKQLASYGVTTCFDMASFNLELFKLKGKPKMADSRHAGLPAAHPKSMHAKVLPLPKEAMVSSPEEAVKFVANRVKDNVDYIKIISDEPGFNKETFEKLIVEAHANNKRVVSHAVTLPGFQLAQESKVDYITHVPMDTAVDDKTIAQIIEQKQIMVPTLIMMQGMSRNMGFRGKKYAPARESVAALYKAGAVILCGTDANYGRLSPNQVVHGESMSQEMILLVEAGMTPLDVLRSATSLPAQYFGVEDRGRIAAGFRADLLLVDGNPLEDIRCVRNVERVWCAGEEISEVAPKQVLKPVFGVGSILSAISKTPKS